jgi:hypothetical protein
MFQKLQGKRTYLVGGLMFVAAVSAAAFGLIPPDDGLQRVLEALGFMGLRAAVPAVGAALNAAPADNGTDNQAELEYLAAEVWRQAQEARPDLPDIDPAGLVKDILQRARG